MQRQIIKPQLDVPVTVKLDKGPEGIERDGKYGIDWQYTVNDDSGVMWLPRDGRDALLRAGAQAGDEVQILKATLAGKTTFTAQVLASDATEPEPEPTPPARNGNGNGHAHVQPRGRAPLPPRAYHQPEAVPRPQQAAKAAPAPSHGAQVLATALYTAIDAALAAEAYAKQQGMDLELQPDDIRAMAISLFIDSRKGEVR
jgi:hypothetical protein